MTAHPTRWLPAERLRPTIRRRSFLSACVAVLSMFAASCAVDRLGEPVVLEDSTVGVQPLADEPADDVSALTTELAEAEPVGPVSGGTLTYGLATATPNAWTAYDAACGSACLLVLGAITDTVFVVDDTGEPVSHLLDHFSSNEDATIWELVPRPGIRFHDGTPFDAEALTYNLNVARSSLLDGPHMAAIEGIDIDGRAVRVRMKLPWASFPAALTGTAGMMFSVDWLQPLETNPRRRVAAEAYHHPTKLTEPTADPTRPIGLGPFVLASAVGGSEGTVELERNDDYWRGTARGSTSEGLPFLDGINLSVIEDSATRRAALDNGDIAAMFVDAAAQLDEGDTTSDGGAEVSILADPTYASTSHIVINVAEGDLDPDGANAESPLLDRRVRRALAHAIDRGRLSDELVRQSTVPANGPFPPGTRGVLAESGYPAFSPADANVLLDEHLTEAGVEAISVGLLVSDDEDDRALGRELRAMWRDTFGSRVRVEMLELGAAEFVARVLKGDYMLASWSVAATVDADERSVLWTGEAARRIGADSFNVGRFADETVDQLMRVSRSNLDGDARQAAAEAINRRFGDLVPALWLTWNRPGVMSNPRVRNIGVHELPAGGRGVALSNGAHSFTQVWCWEANCG